MNQPRSGSTAAHDRTLDPKLERRMFLKALGAAGAAGVAGASGAAITAEADATHAEAHVVRAGEQDSARASVCVLDGYIFFTPVEARFIEAVVDTMIPADDIGPGALEAGVAVYLDRQMAGSFGGGARLYRQGPFAEGTPQQGWQTSMTPAEVMRAGIAWADDLANTRTGSAFAALTPAQRAAVLSEIETSKADATPAPTTPLFFELLLGLVYEGYFGDPIYGGNRGKVVWKMLGFPGVGGMYAEDIVRYRNRHYPATPQSIQDFV